MLNIPWVKLLDNGLPTEIGLFKSCKIVKYFLIIRVSVLYLTMDNSLRFQIKPESHERLNKMWLNIISSRPPHTCFIEGNKVEVKALLWKGVWQVKITLSDSILGTYKKRKAHVLPVRRCLTLEEEYHYNEGANNISKGHHAGIKMRNICPLTMAVTSSWALSLNTWQLGTLFRILVSNPLWYASQKVLLFAKYHPFSEVELTLNVKRQKCWI